MLNVFFLAHLLYFNLQFVFILRYILIEHMMYRKRKYCLTCFCNNNHLDPYPSNIVFRLGESEGSYCTLATFPSETSSSENSSPSSTPPSTPHQEKQTKVQKQQRYSTFGPPQKQKNVSSMPFASLRFKSVPREVSLLFS